jgi:hypothetical protein
LVEQLICNHQVASSIPAAGTIYLQGQHHAMLAFFMGAAQCSASQDTDPRIISWYKLAGTFDFAAKMTYDRFNLERPQLPVSEQ